MEFRTYGHLLKTIKDEYETYIEYLQKQASENQDLRAKLSEMLEREEALREEARANAPASDRVWRVSRPTPTKKSAIGKRVGAFLSPPSSPCP